MSDRHNHRAFVRSTEVSPFSTPGLAVPFGFPFFAVLDVSSVTNKITTVARPSLLLILIGLSLWSSWSFIISLSLSLWVA